MKRILIAPLVLLTIILGLWANSLPLRAKEEPMPVVPLLAAATTGSGAVNQLTMSRCQESAIYISWSAGAASGAVTIESAHVSGYAGTWAPLTTVSWTAASKEDIVQITGVHMNLRTRVSTTITGGTVSTWLVCN